MGPLATAVPTAIPGAADLVVEMSPYDVGLLLTGKISSIVGHRIPPGVGLR